MSATDEGVCNTRKRVRMSAGIYWVDALMCAIGRSIDRFSYWKGKQKMGFALKVCFGTQIQLIKNSR